MAVDPFTSMAVELAAAPALLDQLLADHTADSGGWCRWHHDASRERHPCSICRLARLAQHQPRSLPTAIAAIPLAESSDVPGGRRTSGGLGRDERPAREPSNAVVSTAPRHVRWSFMASPAVPAEARWRLDRQLLKWGVGAEHRESAVLVAHELVTNAVEHARTPLDLTAAFDGHVVAVGVADNSPSAPRLQPHDLRAPHGRGLQMVAALSQRWNYTHHGNGKTVWADITP